MTVEFNHTHVIARDRVAAATFLTDLLGLPAPMLEKAAAVVPLSNGAALAFLDVSHAIYPWDDVRPHHYAFLISESDFDAVLDRIRARGLQYWADPFHQEPAEINTQEGGRVLYFDDLSGHLIELRTSRYDRGSAS